MNITRTLAIRNSHIKTIEIVIICVIKSNEPK